MVMDNICHLLNNFLKCSAYENVIFCWVMHEQRIIDSILAGLDTENYAVVCVSLVADEPELRQRLTADVERGLREGDVIERSAERIPLYSDLDTLKIDTTGKSVLLIAGELRAL